MENNATSPLLPVDVKGEPINVKDYVITTIYGKKDPVLLKVVDMLNKHNFFCQNPGQVNKSTLYNVKYLTKIPNTHFIYTYPEEWLVEMFHHKYYNNVQLINLLKELNIG